METVTDGTVWQCVNVSRESSKRTVTCDAASSNGDTGPGTSGNSLACLGTGHGTETGGVEGGDNRYKQGSDIH